jgi:hypothetical protein
MMVWKKRSLRADVANSGPIMAALYQMLNALPSSCGITGASATMSNPEKFRDFRAGVISTGRATRTISFDLHFSPLGSSKSQFPSSGERRLAACAPRKRPQLFHEAAHRFCEEECSILGITRLGDVAHFSIVGIWELLPPAASMAENNRIKLTAREAPGFCSPEADPGNS